MALKANREPSKDVILSFEQDKQDVNLIAEVEGKRIMIAFFNHNGIFHLCYNTQDQVDLLQGSIAFDEEKRLVID